MTDATFAPARRGPSARTPTSLRHPWTRAGLSGVVLAMLPFTWVLQIDGCTETVEGRATGYDLMRELHFSAPDVALVVALFVIAVLEPRAAAFVGGVRARAWTHFVGLLATSVLVARGISLVFGTTEIRALQPAGIVVLLALVAAFADAVARLAFGAMEKVDHDHPVGVRDG